MSHVRDLFFDEFYAELENIVEGVARENRDAELVPMLRDEVRRHWRPYSPRPEDREEALVSVDGGVQVSNFAHGDFVAVGRACALVNGPNIDQTIVKKVKIYLGKVYEDRDRGFIPSYVRMIAEYDAALAAAERVLEKGGRPLVVLDGTLYISRFPYAIHEYHHHSELLADLFTSIAALHSLSKEMGFPVAAVAKDSMVFYLYMALLKDAAISAGLEKYVPLIDEASSPLDLRLRIAEGPQEILAEVKSFLEERPMCDVALIRASTDDEGYSTPLLLAPSIYYSRENTPALYRRIRRTIEPEKAERVIFALKAFFACPGVAMTYWKPTLDGSPLRVDVSASALGYADPWEKRGRNIFAGDGCDLRMVERVLNHLGFWFCNEVEYNLPLHQADRLARFDRTLYRSKYEPFIISRLERAGLEVSGRRRALREVGM